MVHARTSVQNFLLALLAVLALAAAAFLATGLVGSASDNAGGAWHKQTDTDQAGGAWHKQGPTKGGAWH